MALTLTEYCHQREPVRMPDVLLQEGEYQVLLTWPVAGNFYRSIRIHMFSAAEYVEKFGDGVLWTTDDDGNPKSRSCFRIK